VIAGEQAATVQRRVSRALPLLRKCLERKSRGGGER
jgi:DNA-directed RNA polymerase specialized sigma24 family protein